MISIRGAITVDSNTAQNIINDTIILLKEIININKLDKSKIISIIFTASDDLNKAYPAIAARYLSLNSSSLICLNEMKVENSLGRCIRILMLYNGDIENKKDVYLKEAIILRKDLLSEKVITIAIDGPTGSGKSTVAKIISDKLKINYVDTGAMYRALTKKVIDNNIDPKDEKAVVALMKRTDIDYFENHIFLDSLVVDDDIRNRDIDNNVSDVCKYKGVRDIILNILRNISSKRSVIMDGRDVGTSILPDCKNKFFLTASVDKRSERRYKEYKSKGMHVNIDDIKNDLIRRDQIDSTREISPLKMAEDATLIDSDDLTVENVVKKIIERLK